MIFDRSDEVAVVAGSRTSFTLDVSTISIGLIVHTSSENSLCELRGSG